MFYYRVTGLLYFLHSYVFAFVNCGSIALNMFECVGFGVCLSAWVFVLMAKTLRYSPRKLIRFAK